MNKSTISIQEEQYLFDNGLTIRSAWIMPPGRWEYSISETGVLRNDIAIKTTMRAAYNCGVRYLNNKKISHT